MKFLKKLTILIMGLVVLIGIPYFFGAGWLLGSWLPALFVMIYLED